MEWDLKSFVAIANKIFFAENSHRSIPNVTAWMQFVLQKNSLYISKAHFLFPTNVSFLFVLSVMSYKTLR